MIAIDGGGIRGIIPLIILRRIFESYPQFQSHISWWGTSAGALISASIVNNKRKGLNYLMSTQHTLDFFEFRSSAMLETSQSSISNRPFKTLLDQVFEDCKTTDFQNLNIVSSLLPNFTSHVFNSAESTNLVSALRASCAVPGVFPAIEIGQRIHVDGFLSAKNPSLLAFQNENLCESDLLISIGTGVMPEKDVIETEVENVDLQVREHSKKIGFNYIRLNPDLIKASPDMQNLLPRNIFNLKNDTFSYLETKSKEISDLGTYFNSVNS